MRSGLARAFFGALVLVNLAGCATPVPTRPPARTPVQPTRPPTHTPVQPAPLPTHTPAQPTREASATPTVTVALSIIGRSAGGREIRVHRFGNGPVSIALVGATHGGYEYNTADLMNRAVEHFKAHPSEIPGSISLHIIPVLNPDGMAKEFLGFITD